MPSHFRLSRFTTVNPARLSKAFLLQDGGLVKSPGGNMVNGEVQTMSFESLADFAALLPTLTPAQALAYGTCPHDQARIVTAAKVDAAPKGDLPTLSRTRDHFRYPDVPGLLMVDYDPPKKTDPLSPEQLREALYGVWPALEHAPHVLRPSASSYIYNNESGECLKGQGGLRVWVLVSDAQDIPRAGAVLFKRLWLAGYGRIDVSRAGSLLLRTLVDDAVWQPERLDFCGGAACTAPLEQRLPDPQTFNANAEPLDTRAALPDLTEAEEREFQTLVSQARVDARPRASEQHAIWIEDRVKSALAGQELEPIEREKRVAQLRETLQQAARKRILLGDFELLPDRGDPVTVGELLDHPEKWHGQRFHDPLEPEYGNDARIAVMNLRNAGKPYLYSHAHGGTRFALHRARHEIQVPAGERVHIVAKALELMRLDGGVFDRGGELVRLDGGGSVHPLGLEGLRFYLDGLARWMKFDGRAKDWRPCDCPESVAKGVEASRGNWALPTLKGVATAPFMDPSTGRTVEQDGYDRETGIVLYCNILDRWPGVPTKPTTSQVQAALDALWKPFENFPFVDEVAKGVWLAAILSAPIRAALPTAPAFLFSAPTAGSGKTLLATCIGVLAGVKNPPAMTMTSDEGENRKRLFSTGRTGAPAVLLDNLTGTFESDSICAWLSCQKFTDRVLGQSEMMEIPTNTLMLLTGNNVLLKGDLCRRVLTCEIDPQSERPWSRAFTLNPEGYCRAHRLEMVAAALTVLRAAFGQTTRMQGRTASFEVWSDTVRRAVVWVGEQGLLGVADPMKSVEAAYEADPETGKLEALLGAWHAVYGDYRATVNEVIQRADRDREGDLYAACEEIAGQGREINPRILGRWIERMRNRVVGGMRFEEAGKKSRRKVWRVKVSLVSDVSFHPTKEQICHLTNYIKSAGPTHQTHLTHQSGNYVEGLI